MTNKRASVLPVVTVVFVTIVVVVLLIMTKPQPVIELNEPVVQTVETVEVTRQDVRPQEVIVGRLEPLRKTALSFEVEGVITDKPVRAGEIVEKGEVLLALDDADYRNRLEEIKANYQQEAAAVKRDARLLALSENNVKLSLNEVKRLKNLGKKSLSSKSALDVARQKLSQLRAEQANLSYLVETAESRLLARRSQKEKAQRNVLRTRLFAPYSGRVNRILVEAGDRVTPNKAVIDFIDDSAFEMKIQISRRAVVELTEGMQVKVRLGDLRVAGIVKEFQRDPDPRTFTYEARIKISHDQVLSGMLGEVELPLKPAINAMVVPLSAVLLDDGQSHVFVVTEQEDGTTVLKKKTVQLGLRYKNWQVIVQGVSEHERIVSRDVSALSDQQTVVLQ